MTVTRRNNLSLLAVFSALVCFVVALLIATNEVIHSGNQAACVDGGFVAVTAALLLHWWE